MLKHLILFSYLLLGTTLLFSQKTDAQKELIERINKNNVLLNTNPEKAFEEAKNIEKEAQSINAKEAELLAIETQCSYYNTQKEYEKMLTTAQALYQKAGNYKKPVIQVLAKQHLFDAYLFSGLNDEAFRELEQGKEIMDKLKEEDYATIAIRANLLISYCNYYSVINDLQNQVKYTILTGKELEKISDKEKREESLFIQYSNLGGLYVELNQTDSARYYAELSQSKYKEEYNRDDIRLQNLLILGKVALNEKDYQKALSYFKKGETLDGYKNHLNLELLYDNIIVAYQQLQEEDSVKIYQVKRDSLKLDVAESKNKSLYTLLKEQKESKPVYLYALVAILVVMAVVTFLVIRKNRLLSRQEKTSREYLERISENPCGEDYSRLLKALKENDPAFMFVFEETFPDFSARLLKVNPKISANDIEFCALLKIKIPTKDIARYRFIDPATVRNKKYLVRKKLNIPNDIDIYQWFDEV